MVSSSQKQQWVKQLKEKDEVRDTFLIKVSSLATGKNNKPYMNLVFMDKTGEIEGRIWEEVSNYAGQAVRDAFVRVEGKCQSYQGRLQIIVHRLQILREDEVQWIDFLPESHVDPEQLYQRLLGYIHSMQDPDYRALAEVIFEEDSEIVERLKKAPAAKTMHHAYPSGLLEHVVSILGILNDLSRHYGKAVDRDLLFLGGLLHDVGKLWELSYERVTDYTTEGQLIGHLVMGVELVTQKVQQLEQSTGRLPGPFPAIKKLLIKHVILAHHGKLEYGSPKEPHCLEALIVHMVDDLDSKVNSIQQFIKRDSNPGSWTLLNRQYGRTFYKAPELLENKKM